MKMNLTFALMLVAVLAPAIHATANDNGGILYSVADSWYFNSVAEGVLTVKDNGAEYAFEINEGVNFLGLQRNFKGQLRFVNFTSTATTTNFRHIVIWDFKEGLSTADKDFFFDAMKADLENLAGIIPGIVELRVMRDIVNVGINGEGQIVLDAVFESQDAYEVYRVHPDHLNIAGFVVENVVENRRGVNFLESEPTGHTDKFRHIVIWEFQAHLDEEEKDSLFNLMKEDLEGLVGVIDGLIELNVFKDHYNVVGNGQVALIALYDSMEDWSINYVPHPDHQRIAAYVVNDIVIAGTRRGGNFYELD